MANAAALGDRETLHIEQMVGAIRGLGVERTFRRAYGVSDRWNWRVRSGRIPSRIGIKSELDARLNAISTIETAAGEGEDAVFPAMAALCAFVRDNCEIEDEAAAHEPRPDVQAAMEAIGRLERLRAQGAGFKAASLESEVFRANLMLSMLTFVRMPGALLSGADLTGCRLDYADLSDAMLPGASLIAARLKGAHLRRATLSGAQFLGAYLEGADFDHAQMQDADLSYTDFREVRLNGARLDRANLEAWQCERASLRGASLAGVRNLDPASLQTCHGVKSGIGRTILPEGVAPPLHWYAAAETGQDSDAAAKAYETRYRSWLTVYTNRV